jgi:thioredoxin reductase (NADPH)
MENSTILDILIVGAGPSGIAAAVEAKRQGLDKIKVLEKGPSHSSMIRSYYKEGKRVDAGYAGIEPICFGVMCLRDGNRETFLSFMDFAIESNKIQIEYQCEVWSIEKKQDLFIIQSNKGVFQARAVIIAIGKMGKPNTPSYYNQIPASLKNQKAILFDINTREINQLNVLVVGGGDSAGEYLDMLHNTNKVFWSYRQKEIQKMNELNKKIVLSLIENNKISPLWGTEITNIEDEQGKAKVYFQNSNFSPLSVDVVLYGLGGMTPVNFLKNIS